MSKDQASNLKLRLNGPSKPPLTLVPYHALVGVARVLEDSEIKYSPQNYIEQSLADAAAAYDSAQLRHRLASTPLAGGITPESLAAIDADSGLPHIDHMISGLLILRLLLIRDGLLAEDPGPGRRKRAESPSPWIEAGVVPGADDSMPELTVKRGGRL